MRSYYLAIISIFLFLIISSCTKKTDCYATVVSKDASGNVVSGATVQLFAYVKNENGGMLSDVISEGVSNEEGKVSFGFRRPSIYNIQVMKGNLSGKGMIQLVARKEIQKDVIVQ